MQFTPMWKTFWWLLHSNPAFYFIFIGIALLYVSGIAFIWDYFVRVSVRILMSGVATMILGAVLACLHGATQAESDFKDAFKTKP